MKTIIKFMLLGTISLFGFEVNTHQALTRCAITPYVPECSTEGTKNLDDFVSHVELRSINYEDQIFDKYMEKYNSRRLHSALDNRTPNKVYFESINNLEFQQQALQTVS